MKAIILAGGFGKRLRPMTDITPKPMLLVAGKPILEWQMEWLRAAGVGEFVLCIGHLKEHIMGHFGDGSPMGIRVRYAVENEPLGSGGALHNALTLFPTSEPFFFLNGDVITDLDLKEVIEAFSQPGVVGALSLVPLPSPFGIVVADAAGRVQEFREKPRIMDQWINAGVYRFAPSVKDYLPAKGSLETDVFPRLAKEGRLVARRFPDSFWMSVDSPKDLEEASKALGVGKKAPPSRLG